MEAVSWHRVHSAVWCADFDHHEWTPMDIITIWNAGITSLAHQGDTEQRGARTTVYITNIR
jgi:hypothetical protein